MTKHIMSINILLYVCMETGFIQFAVSSFVFAMRIGENTKIKTWNQKRKTETRKREMLSFCVFAFAYSPTCFRFFPFCYVKFKSGKVNILYIMFKMRTLFINHPVTPCYVWRFYSHVKTPTLPHLFTKRGAFGP